MDSSLDRREMLRRTATSLASIFCVGELQFDAARTSPEDDLFLAAATSFELAIQQLFIPYGAAKGTFDVPADVRAEALEISKRLNPSNAPAIFLAANVTAKRKEVVVQFNETVAVLISNRSVVQLRRFLSRHPNADGEVAALSNQEVVEYIVESFTVEENWNYDD